MEALKATDLRIGNLIEYQDQEGWYVLSVTHQELDEPVLSESFRPIPLTPDLLMKCGFENSQTQDKFYTRNSFGISTADDKFTLVKGNFVCQIVLRELKYLHELQNAIYAIKGQELTVKL